MQLDPLGQSLYLDWRIFRLDCGILKNTTQREMKIEIFLVKTSIKIIDSASVLARSIYQIEEVLLQKCQNIRKNKELELAVLQQPIRNWTGEPIDELGSLRLMTPVSFL
jgi:hypothetical protein